MAREYEMEFEFIDADGTQTINYGGGAQEVFRSHTSPRDPSVRIVDVYSDTLTGKGPRTEVFERRWDSYEQAPYETKTTLTGILLEDIIKKSV